MASPWFQQRNPMVSQAATAAAATVPERAPSTMTEMEMEELNRRLLRPTTSSRAKVNQSWKLDNTFMDKDRHAWSKMELFEDCKKCMWTNQGTIKSSCKIRPLNPTPR